MSDACGGLCLFLIFLAGAFVGYRFCKVFGEPATMCLLQVENAMLKRELEAFRETGTVPTGRRIVFDAEGKFVTVEEEQA